MRWNGDTTCKNKLFPQLVSAVAVLERYVEFVICDFFISDVYIYIYIKQSKQESSLTPSKDDHKMRCIL